MRSSAAAVNRAHREGLVAFAVLTVAVLLAYHGSLAVPFFFDDTQAITHNPTIRSLGKIGTVLAPPADGGGTTGRPVVNLSLALNYAAGGLNPRGYHIFNLALHLACALTVFGVVRRTLLLPRLHARYAPAAFRLALAAAVIWCVHPLHTETVTCVIQRTELLIGTFMLFTLYAFVRSVAGSRPGPWPGLSIAACALGMASKEVMVSAPLLVLLYDRTFVAGTFRAAWAQRRSYYLQLAATWIILAALLVGMGGSRGPAAGFGLGVPWWAYALKQCEAIPAYLALSFWPHPLVLDYGTDVVRDLAQVLLPGALLLVLMRLAFVALRRWSAIGFLAFWFFAILAPSSSVIPLVTQTMAEHRMYLPLAAVVVLVVITVHHVIRSRLLSATVLLTAALTSVTVARNRLMQDELTIWADTLAKRPGNPRAHASYALALGNRGRPADAIPFFRRALDLDPDSAATELNLGTTYFELGDYLQAATHFRRAIALNDQLAAAHTNLGAALLELGDAEGALASHRRALALDPDHAGAHRNAGRTLFGLGRFAEAASHYEHVLRLSPLSPDAHYDLGLALARSGDLSRARPHFSEALRLRPDPAGYLNYARFLAGAGDLTGARDNLETALRLRPDFAEAQQELERLRALPRSSAGR